MGSSRPSMATPSSVATTVRPHAHTDTHSTPTHTHTRTYGPAAAPDHRSACGRSLVHFHNKTQGLMRPPFAGLALAARCTSMSPLVSACTVRPVPSRVVLGSGPSIIGLPYRTCFLFFCVFLFREAACSSATPPRARARAAPPAPRTRGPTRRARTRLERPCSYNAAKLLHAADLQLLQAPTAGSHAIQLYGPGELPWGSF